MTTLLLARHGRTQWNLEGRFQGWADPPLDGHGRAEAQALAATLASEPAVAVVASPLRRALETAEIVAERHGLAVRSEPGVKEVDVGEWSGLTRDEVATRYPEAWARWLDFGRGWEQGETYEQLGARVVPALLRIAADHAGGPVVVVTHGGPIRAALAAADGVTWQEARRMLPIVQNCEVVRLVAREGALRRPA